MDFSLKENFDKHSKVYGRRVRNRKKYPKLTLEDTILVRFLKSRWFLKKKGILIDAGCGTGDRLQMLFMKQGLPRYWFREIIGLDYSEGMLEYAKQQKINSKPMYTNIKLVDLYNLKEPIEGDLVICLWSIINHYGIGADRLLFQLGKLVSRKGFLIYDSVSTQADSFEKEEKDVLKAHPELKPHIDKQTFWYKRGDDGSIGYLRLFSPHEFILLLKSVGLPLIQLWGYDENKLVPIQIPVTNGIFDERMVSKYTNLIFIHENT